MYLCVYFLYIQNELLIEFSIFYAPLNFSIFVYLDKCDYFDI